MIMHVIWVCYIFLYMKRVGFNKLLAEGAQLNDGDYFRAQLHNADAKSLESESTPRLIRALVGTKGVPCDHASRLT